MSSETRETRETRQDVARLGTGAARLVPAEKTARKASRPESSAAENSHVPCVPCIPCIPWISEISATECPMLRPNIFESIFEHRLLKHC